MIRTIISIFVTLGLIVGLAGYELYYVHTTFAYFTQILDSLYNKVQLQTATDEDGSSVREFWETEKKRMHVWLPHTILMEVDYQIDEAIGFIYVKDYEAALPKLEVVMGIVEDIPQSYTLNLPNIF